MRKNHYGIFDLKSKFGSQWRVGCHSPQTELRNSVYFGMIYDLIDLPLVGQSSGHVTSPAALQAQILGSNKSPGGHVRDPPAPG